MDIKKERPIKMNNQVYLSLFNKQTTKIVFKGYKSEKILIPIGIL